MVIAVVNKETNKYINTFLAGFNKETEKQKWLESVNYVTVTVVYDRCCFKSILELVDWSLYMICCLKLC